MLSVTAHVDRSALLEGFLAQLQAGEISVIEYGDPNQPGGHFGYVRVKWMNTAGGMQFRIAQLSRGQEGSGVYYPDVKHTAMQCLLMIDRYHAKSLDTRLRFVSPGVPPSLTWFTFEPGQELQCPGPTTKADVDAMFPGATVVDLTLKD